MKNKYLLFCITLSILLALSGCGKSEVPQEDITHNQSLHNDNHVDESSDNNKNRTETIEIKSEIERIQDEIAKVEVKDRKSTRLNSSH